MKNTRKCAAALAIVANVFATGVVHAEGGATYTPGTDQHLDMQHQVGAKTFKDCGRASEADLVTHDSDKNWKPSKEIRELIGTPAPEFARDLQWVGCKPMTMAELRGRPVFVRFWYRNCDMCDSTAPMMNELESKYGKDGLVVIGIHHSKTIKGDSVEEVETAARKLGYKFPIAIDNSWSTVEKFWIHSEQRAFSSASFLINPKGIIVWGHDLGRLEKGSVAARSLHQAIDSMSTTSLHKTDQ